MAGVGGLGCEDDLSITGQPQVMYMMAMINQSNVPNFNIIISRDCHLHNQRDILITALKLGLMGIKHDLLEIRVDRGWLVSG